MFFQEKNRKEKNAQSGERPEPPNMRMGGDVVLKILFLSARLKIWESETIVNPGSTSGRANLSSVPAVDTDLAPCWSSNRAQLRPWMFFLPKDSPARLRDEPGSLRLNTHSSQITR